MVGPFRRITVLRSRFPQDCKVGALTVLPKGDPQQLVERLRKNHGNQTVLLIGHTDTLPDLLKALGHPVEIKIDAQDYSNIFVVIPKRDGAPTLVRLRY